MPVRATEALANSGADPVVGRLDAKWVSAVVGMKVETPAGALLGRVRDVVVDGYGHARFAIVSYGGFMGLDIKYTAVPWATVADLLQRDRLLVDRSTLENAPLLMSAKPESGSTRWRSEAERYWSGRVAVAR